ISTLLLAVSALVLGGSSIDLDGVISVLPVYFFFSLLAALVFGAPSFAALAYFNIVKWWSVVGGGIVAGCLAIAVLKRGLPQPSELAAFGLTGAISSIGFWVMWQRVR